MDFDDNLLDDAINRTHTHTPTTFVMSIYHFSLFIQPKPSNYCYHYDSTFFSDGKHLFCLNSFLWNDVFVSILFNNNLAIIIHSLGLLYFVKSIFLATNSPIIFSLKNALFLYQFFFVSKKNNCILANKCQLQNNGEKKKWKPKPFHLRKTN